MVSKYVLDELVRDEVIGSGPIAGRRIDLRQRWSSESAKGGWALSAKEWSKVIDCLLALDSEEGIEPVTFIVKQPTGSSPRRRPRT